jgi:O-antigen/teichoic acid export membrane protein
MNMGGASDGRLAAMPTSAATVRALAPLSLRANFAWTLGGTTIYGLSQWGMLIALAKLGSPEIVGRYALALAISAPVVMFTNLQLRIVQATDARDQYRLGDYVSLRFAMSATALLIVAGAAFIGPYRPEVRPVILFVGAAKCVESISDVIHGFWQKHERLDLTAISMTIKGPTSLLAMCLIMAATHNVMWAAVGMFGTWALVLLTYDVANLRRVARLRAPADGADLRQGLRAPLRLPAMRSLALLALPLGVVGLLDSLQVNVPRYSIERVLGEASLGFFAAMAYLVQAGNMIVNALAQSAAPRLAKHYVNDARAFRRLMWHLVRFALVLGASGIAISLLFGRQLLTVMYRAEYGAHAGVLVWLMVAACLGYIARFLVATITAARRLRAQAPLYALTLATVAGLSALLIPRFGLTGAAWAMCGAMTVLLAGTIIIHTQAVRYHPQEQADAAEIPAGAG